MKSIIFISIVLLFSLSAFCQEQEFVKFYYPDGQLSSEGNMVNGKPDGYWKTFYTNGKLKSEGNRFDQQLDSLWKFYGDDGKLLQQVNYRKDKKNGERVIYDEHGYLSKREFFTDDVRSKRIETYYVSGALQEMIPVDTLGKGKEHGIGYEYDDSDGRIIAVVVYSNGYVGSRERINRKDKFNQKQGVWKSFYSSMRVQSEGKYKNDKKHGYWKEYDENGNLLETLKFEEGIQILDPEELAKLDIKRKFYANAQVKTEGSYNKGIEEGVHRAFSIDGKVESAKIYRKGRVMGEGIVDTEGRRQGDWNEYFETGELRSKGRYKDNKRTGFWIFYYQDGKIEQEGNYREGRADGNWRWIHRNGQTWREEIFYEGLEEGAAVEYSDSASVIAKGEYVEGAREGLWVIDVGSHREEGEYRIGQRSGLWKYYFRNDKLKFEGKYTDGMEEGIHQLYFDNGLLRQTGRYKFAEREGDWIEYNEDGTIKQVVTFERGIVVKVDGSKAPKVETSEEEQ